MRSLFLLFLGFGVLFANDTAAFFKASTDHKLLCRTGYETYMLLSQNNASTVLINSNIFFKYKDENLYIPENSCAPVTEHKEPITY